MASSMMRKVLVLGSGFMSGALIEMLTRDGLIAVTVGEYSRLIGCVFMYVHV